MLCVMQLGMVLVLDMLGVDTVETKLRLWLPVVPPTFEFLVYVLGLLISRIHTSK